jgi:hypothetical protein
MYNFEFNDGINGIVQKEKMSKGALKMRDFYEKKPNASIYQCEFGYYSLDRWKSEGFISEKTNLNELFGFDEPGVHGLGQLGWCEAAFNPVFDEKLIEDRGEHEVVQDYAGRHVLYFKGRRNGFMPEYLDHPVKDIKTWEENCKWRLDPKTIDRYSDLDKRMQDARESAAKGMVISQGLVGGYMYLRSLIGPVDLLYKFYDDPELIHECMKTWFELADAIITKHQEYVTIDEIFFAEDISYNNGLLISPGFVREFLFPYYQQIINNLRARQIDKSRHLYIQIDTDGFSDPIIPLYKEIGMDYLSPFEVASGSDVLRTGSQYPELLIRGGMDKRLLSQGKDSIDRLVDKIMPVMKARGGYIPTCDHGVPEEVSFEDYVYFRKRLLEFS